MGSIIFAMRFLFLGCAVSIWMATAVSACNIPVFRYALENWRPDAYHVVVIYRGNLSQSQRELVTKLRGASSDEKEPANLVVFDIDLDATDGAESNEREEIPQLTKQAILNHFGDTELSEPQVVAFFPPRGPVYEKAWQGTLTADNVNSLVRSPVRTEITKRILDGQSAVWILLKTGDAAKDKMAEELLKKQLSIMNQEVSLPDQSLIEAEDEFRPDNPIELRVEFSLISIAKDDLKEKVFVETLLAIEPDLVEYNEPIAIPVFGRGRTYYGLVGKGINPQMIEEHCHFICGACSCQVKQGNPGMDLLVAMDWTSRIIGTAMREVELPDLTGIGFLEVGADVDRMLQQEKTDAANSEVDTATDDTATDDTATDDTATDDTATDDTATDDTATDDAATVDPSTPPTTDPSSQVAMLPADSTPNGNSALETATVGLEENDGYNRRIVAWTIGILAGLVIVFGSASFFVLRRV